MHELPVTESILEITLRHAAQAGGRKVAHIYLVMGELSSIVDDSVQFYWDFVSKDTLAEGAQLHFRRIPAEMRCEECGRRYEPREKGLMCPDCGGANVRVVAGEEFYVEAIDVLTEEQEQIEGAGA
jgi:hydrogenase nickel incorporation protein HypA/HybF